MNRAGLSERRDTEKNVIIHNALKRRQRENTSQTLAPVEEKTVPAFDILEKLEERNLLHIRDRIFAALDDRDIINCSQVSESWQSYMETIRLKRKKMLRMEMGAIGGAGHFWGKDKIISRGGVRNGMKEKELKKVLRLLALGEKKINLKEREFPAFMNEKKPERNSKKVL
ncbi:unnamed protein product [Oikopleura dioica]|uniref:Uncharacterized protein n=1 Tax=Oikopleura dioica TaxID=34765 RepID=E4YCX7_OIKDI|nr:unnamed protein product [Oikopleura dioica]